MLTYPEGTVERQDELRGKKTKIVFLSHYKQVIDELQFSQYKDGTD